MENLDCVTKAKIIVCVESSERINQINEEKKIGIMDSFVLKKKKNTRFLLVVINYCDLFEFVESDESLSR